MFYRLDQDKLIINIRLTPKASGNSLGGIYTDANGIDYLKAGVTAVAEDNKANLALIDLLAKRLKTSKSNFSIIQGHTNRNKVICLQEIDSTISELLNQFIHQ